MNQLVNLLQNSIPDDIALKIASSLQVFDVCSLGSCSRFWRELCGSDSLWEALCKDRWPAIDLGQSNDFDQEMDANFKGCWRMLYIRKHNEMAEKAQVVINLVEKAALSCESIESGNYLKAMELLNSQHFKFKDVEMFLLKSNLSVLLNLVALHYCILWLRVPAKYITEVLSRNDISERKVCVQWWKLGRWFYGFRLRDEVLSHNVSLGELAWCSSNEEVLSVLHRGAIHEVIRVQISAAKPINVSWSFQMSQSHVNI